MKYKLLVKISFTLHCILAKDTTARYPASSKLCFDIFAAIQSVYIIDAMRNDSIKFDLKIYFYFDYYFHYIIRKDYRKIFLGI